MNTSKWVKFFTEAGLPTSVATKYAVVFTDHRIQIDMLADLTKEILYDMGIKTMGDVIAILRHAKNVHDEKTKEKLLGTVDDEVDTPKRMISLTRNNQTRTSISDRIIANTGSGPSGLLKRPIQSNSLQSPTKVIRLGSSSNEQSSSSIFNRLGAPTNTIDIQSGSVFMRLGGANDSSSSSSSSRIVSLNSKAQSSSTFNSIRPTNMLIKKSLADTNVSNKVVIRTNTSNSGMRNDTTGIKARLGNQQSGHGRIIKAAATSTTSSRMLQARRMVQKKRIVTPPKQNTRISLKKTVFDRLGPMS